MATWKKVIISGSDISQLNNDLNYLENGQDNAVLTGSFSGSFVGTTDLPDLTDGNGIVDFIYDGSGPASVTVLADESTINVEAAGIKVADSGITATQISTTVAGAGLSGGGGTALAVNVDGSSIEIDTDTLRVKALGITNAMLLNDSLTVGSTELTLGTTTTTVDGLTLTNTTATGSFTGSFTGDGSGLTGLATTLTVDGDTGSEGVDLLADDLQIITNSTLNSAVTKVGTDVKVSLNIPDGGVTETQLNATVAGTGIAGGAGTALSLAIGDIISNDGANRVLTSDGDGTLTAEQNFTFTGTDLTVTGNQIITGDLTVQGTASFQETENLRIADRFALFASGSTTTGDGGIVVQQATSDIGELFGYDSGTSRWAVTSSFDASTSAFTPDAFMAVSLVGTADDPTAVDSRYQAKGNIFIANNEDIFIYS